MCGHHFLVLCKKKVSNDSDHYPYYQNNFPSCSHRSKKLLKCLDNTQIKQFQFYVF